MNSRRILSIVWRVLTPRLRRRFVVLQFVSVLMALSTVIGLAAIMPFFAVLADPAVMGQHAALIWLQQTLHITTRSDLLLILGCAFVALLLLSAVVNLGGSYAMGRFAFAVGDRIREALFADYLSRDYLFHVRAGAARLMNEVLYQADRVPITLLNGMVLITNAVLTVLVVASIAVVNPAVALIGVLTIAGSYVLLYRLVRSAVARNGSLQVHLNAARISVVDQAFRSIKYLLIARGQAAFTDRFSEVTRTLSHTLADTQYIAQWPRYVLEFVAGTAVIGCAAFVSAGTAGAAWLAQLSFIGFAGFRLLPAFQQMYSAVVVIRNNRPALENLASQLDAAPRARPVAESQRSPEAPGFVRSVELINVSFRYSPEAPLVLDKATLRIAAGAAIGIVGASGCGKTTLADLILGLLVPLHGCIEIDGQALELSRISAWQQSVGYVPQDAMILDTSVRANIAFGIEPTEIDDALVRQVALEAGASEFIEALPGGYAAQVSDMGRGLSGGQRQRIAIARALYRKPSLLVLDEATNSLDADTERAIIDTVVRNRGSRTLLIAAHGAGVIGACDRIYELRDGALHERESTSARGHAPVAGVRR